MIKKVDVNVSLFPFNFDFEDNDSLVFFKVQIVEKYRKLSTK